MMRGGLLSADEGRQLFAEARQLPRQGTGTRERADIGFDAVMTYLRWGDRAQAEVERQELAKLATETQHRTAVTMSGAVEALFAMLDGRLHEALEHTVIGAFGTAHHAWRARIANWLGETAILAEELTWIESLNSFFTPAFRAFLLAQAGRPDEAREVLAGLPELVTDRPRPFYGFMVLFLEAAAVSGDKTAAPVLLELVNEDWRFLGALPFVLVPRHLASVAALMGDFERAKSGYFDAIDYCESISYRPELALTRLDLANLLIRHAASPALSQGERDQERDEAFAHLDAAIAEFEAMGMRPPLERALRLRGRRHAARDPNAHTYQDGLTEREVEVLRLLVAGKTNREIAEALFLSIRTVERHISNVYLKTDTHGRAQAAAYTIAHGLT
jgi:DNA-binding CsgD family transcriptional regulator